MKKIGNGKGITLIALIITIIILLILAGISISTLTNTELFSKAKEAKVQTEIASEKEIIQRAAIVARMGTNDVIDLQEENFRSELEKEAGAEKIELSALSDTYEVYFKDSKRYYEVDKYGNVGDYKTVVEDKYPGDITKDKNGNSLDGSEEHPYEIWCIEDLVNYSRICSTYEVSDYADKNIVLCRDLNFKSKFSYQNPDTTEYDEFLGGDGTTKLIDQLSEKGNGFKPIQAGPSENMQIANMIDGNGFRLEEIYIYQTGYAGLISTIYSGMIVKNLTIAGEITSTEYSAGGICGRIVVKPEAKIINCHNEATITGTQAAGGITGSNCATIQNSSNKGKIVAQGKAGGITGDMRGEILNCYNEGNIISMDDCAGGITAASSATVTIIINNSYNKGNVQAKYGAGGICGYIYHLAIITNVYNTGKIESGDSRVGGIIGSALWQNPDNKLSFCYYLDNQEKGIGATITDVTTKYTPDTMKSAEFVEELNSNITLYQTENTDTDTSNWKSWKQGKNGYPVFE